MRLENGAVMSCRIEPGNWDNRLPAYASAERRDVGGGISVVIFGLVERLFVLLHVIAPRNLLLQLSE